MNHVPGAEIRGVLVCRQAEPGLEVIVGSLQDALFGPTMMFGLGGVLVEVLKDGVSQVRYGYTADGRLAWRREVAAGRTVWYVHDGTQVIQEIQTAPSAVLVQEYCWQETTLLETRKPGSWIRTLHQDRLGSVVAATAIFALISPSSARSSSSWKQTAASLKWKNWIWSTISSTRHLSFPMPNIGTRKIIGPRQ